MKQSIDKQMFDLFSEAGYELFLVGGSVRDRLLGITPDDTDYATDAPPGEVIDFLSDRGIKVIPTGMPYGTVTAIDPSSSEKVEITTFRSSEVYRRRSRKPVVQFGKSIMEDLQRRDFTVNAMAMDSEGKLIDPFQGREDLDKRLLNTPGDPFDSFSDDPLRILRAYRFSARLGFSLHQRVRKAARKLASGLDTVSAERKLKEMSALLTSLDGTVVVRSLAMMKEDGVLLRIVPELENLFVIDGLLQGRYHNSDVWHHSLRVVENVPPSDILRWAALLHDSGKGLTRTVDENGAPHFYGHETEGRSLVESVAERLKFPRYLKRSVMLLVENHMRPVLYDSKWSNSAVRRLVRQSGEQLDNLLVLAEADIKAHVPDFVEPALERLSELKARIKNQTSGRVIPREMGQKLSALGFEGAVIGRVLEMLDDMAADGLLPENPTVDQCFSALWEKQETEE
ncbi:RNA nucleotidyltransferase [Candidatus Fermentibacteria bacterium]|nr:MAG: RNA nucleotidyltransferase [Candidatus Fermentibacteria bacterium]